MIQKIALGIAALALIVAGVAITQKDDSTGLFGGIANFQKQSFIAGLYAGDNRQLDIDKDGIITAYTQEKTELVTADNTLTDEETGLTTLISTTGSTTTLPAVEAGLVYRFVVSAAFDTNNFVIDSAEGDNIEGALIVAGAVVDCAGEDQVNFVADGENVGDYVELRSDGTNWLLTQSNGLTAAKITCTDPT